MIAWLNPAALAGLAVLAIPVVIHLLRRHQAARMMFPSLRFVHPARTAALRLRRVSDPWLLLVRLAILALAAAAAAQPVMLTPFRLSAWNARVARAIVVDTSDSMRLHGAEPAAREAADAESRGAAAVTRIETADLDAGVARAAAWLAGAPPARREIVIISDFQAGAVPANRFAGVEGLVGLRAVQVGGSRDVHAFDGAPLLSAAGTLRRRTIRIDPGTTQLTVSAGAGGTSTTGLRLVTAPLERGAAEALLRAVSAAGTPAPAAAEPIAVIFTGAEPPAALRPIAADWMLATVVRMMDDGSEVHAASALAAAAERVSGDVWTVVSRDAQDRPAVRAAAAGDELIIDVAGAPGSYLAAAAVRGALVARQPRSADAEQEIARATPDDLRSWSRAPAPVGREVAVHAVQTDARWFWMLALGMLGIETVVRRSRPVAAREVDADAA
jgi:hypothetical protein